MSNRTLGLASQSEGRRMLLKLMGINFISDIPVVDEEKLKINYNRDLPEELVQKLALNKARSVAKKLFDKGADVVVGADTLIIFKDRIIGKPKNVAEAKNLLLKFSSNTHKIISGLAIVTLDGKYKTNYASALVTFSEINIETIEKYTTLYNPEKYAGGYRLIGPSAFFIKKIEGDYSTIIGLPIHLLGKMMEKFGYNWIDFVKL